MSFKYAAQKISDYEWLLDKGVSTPIRVFMNQVLYDQSEEEMWRQATWATNIPSVKQIVLTVDAHVGAGVPVGIVVGTSNHIAPCASGYDISCGVALLKTNLTKEDIAPKEKRRAWIQAVLDRVACGMGTHQSPLQKKFKAGSFQDIVQNGINAFDVPKSVKERFERDSHKVLNYECYKRAEERGIPSLGSLGGGNHFLELQQDSNGGGVYVMIHTGSRGYGHQIATDFFNEGLEWWNTNHPEKQLGKGQKELISFPVDSDIGKRYYNAMNQAANYAIANRFLISMAIMEAIQDVFKGTTEVFYEISHNLVQIEGGLLVHRKGATRALPAGHPLLVGTVHEQTGHPVLIPGSMGTSSAVLMPVDSAKSLYSVNHGCGRVMGRMDAKRRSMVEGSLTSQNILNKEMDDMDILYNSRNVPIDESLHCYKDIDQVLETVEGAGLAKVCIRLYPRAVIKGND